MSDFSPPPQKNGKRKHLLEVAERLFAQQGFEAVSVRQLVDEAKTNIAMVKYYFGSKDGLFQALIAEKFPRTRERLAEIAELPITPWEKILKAVDMYVEKLFQGRNFHLIIMRELSLCQRPEHVKLITEHLAYSLGVVRGFIEEGQEQGMFRKVDAELTVATLFGAFSSLISHCSLMRVMLKEDCEENIYSENNLTRFKEHLVGLLQAHLIK
jgi:AcrR family transcriptional regulator